MHRLWVLIFSALQGLTAWALPMAQPYARNLSFPSLANVLVNSSGAGGFSGCFKSPKSFLRKRIRTSSANPLGNSPRIKMALGAKVPHANASLPYKSTSQPESPDAAIKYNSEPTKINYSMDEAKALEKGVVELTRSMRTWQDAESSRPRRPLAKVDTTNLPIPIPPLRNVAAVRPSSKPYSVPGTFRKSKWGFQSGISEPAYDAAPRAISAKTRTVPSPHTPGIDRMRIFPSLKLDHAGSPTPQDRPAVAQNVDRPQRASAPGIAPLSGSAPTIRQPVQSLVLVIDGSVDVIRQNGTHVNLAARAGAPAGAVNRHVEQGGAAPQAGSANAVVPTVAPQMVGFGTQGCGNHCCGCVNPGGCQCGFNLQCPCMHRGCLWN
jgi:hypothetical protein